MKIVKGQKAITLIALIVTVIVLLILAGITIGMLTGDNGILTKARETKEKTEEAQENELRQLTMLEAATNLKNTTYIDKNNETAIIPAGFAVSQVEGENIIENGLVIIDKKGNEFVWIPVDKNTLCVDGIENKEVAKLQKDSTINYEGISYTFSAGNTSEKRPSAGIGTKSIREPDVVTTYDNDKEQYLDIINDILKNVEVEPNFTELNNADDLKDYLQRDYNAIIESIKTNGGLYIGRYESSLGSSNATTDGETGNIQSKKNVLPAGANNSSTTYRWYGLYAKQKEFASTLEGTTIKSTMIYGSMYDAIMNWALYDEAEKSKITSPSTKRGSKQPTGTLESDKIKNIYDLGNNMWEWTVEANLDENRIGRGGYYGNTNAPSIRNSGNPCDCDTGTGSRLLLYF